MRLLVGLGNPGPRYASTRHNIGFRVLDAFALARGAVIVEDRYQGRFGEASFEGRPLALLEPQTYMNASGQALVAALEGLEIADSSNSVLAIYDDLDLPFGQIRLRASGGAGGHRGVGSLIASLAEVGLPAAFLRLRFGIGRPSQDIETIDYVLDHFSDREEGLLPDRISRAVEALEATLRDGIDSAMSRFNHSIEEEDPC